MTRGINDPARMNELDALAGQWLEERRGGHGSPIWFRFLQLAAQDPEAGWTLTLALLRQAAPDLEAGSPRGGLGIHIARVLNKVLEHHLVDFIDRVEREANANASFQGVLQHLSLPSDAAEADVVDRLRGASRGAVRVYPAPGTELARVAYDVAERFRSGALPGIPRGTRYPVPLLAREIERILPGHPQEDYSVAASEALHWSR